MPLDNMPEKKESAAGVSGVLLSRWSLSQYALSHLAGQGASCLQVFGVG